MCLSVCFGVSPTVSVVVVRPVRACFACTSSPRTSESLLFLGNAIDVTPCDRLCERLLLTKILSLSLSPSLSFSLSHSLTLLFYRTLASIELIPGIREETGESNRECYRCVCPVGKRPVLSSCESVYPKDSVCSLTRALSTASPFPPLTLFLHRPISVPLIHLFLFSVFPSLYRSLIILYFRRLS